MQVFAKRLQYLFAYFSQMKKTQEDLSLSLHCTLLFQQPYFCKAIFMQIVIVLGLLGTLHLSKLT